MNKFSLATAGIIVAALVTSVSVNAATDTTKTNVTPKGMSCRPQSADDGASRFLGAE